MSGISDPVIRETMNEDRFNQISACLSFARPGTASGWSKFSYVDWWVRQACRSAVGITQHLAVDESMIKCFSRYCNWKQYMPRKPIKTRIKVFSLCLATGYLYDWHVYTGSGDATCGSMFVLIYDILLTYEFDHIGCILFCDLSLFGDILV